jgi:hypothetical protein
MHSDARQGSHFRARIAWVLPVAPPDARADPLIGAHHAAYIVGSSEFHPILVFSSDSCPPPLCLLHLVALALFFHGATTTLGRWGWWRGGRWRRRRGGRQGLRLITVGASPPHRRCPRPCHHRSSSPRCLSPLATPRLDKHRAR